VAAVPGDVSLTPLKKKGGRLYIYIFLIRAVGSDYAHFVRRPLVGPFYQPRMIDEYGEFSGIRISRGN
jgi:hypothetical protein